MEASCLHSISLIVSSIGNQMPTVQRVALFLIFPDIFRVLLVSLYLL